MIGIDLVAVHRIEKLSGRAWYTAFWLRPEEFLYLSEKPNAGESLAGAITAKEAVMKAVGRGFRQGTRPANILLEWSPSGAPSATFEGTRYLLSVTHADGYAAAVALQSGAAA
ncbi:4'-phosphopantetheinyl transferase superfamily protein [Janibacter melonis]|uniref:holo-ACP synthase n=1 Tax=Janibacter melonis TaxID=262209 RepID=UPI0020446DFB|nr:4'-phosphopantetheinyl transferase superfamily protein [Janibacter melonis]MCM3556836.1 4'-phosphopantetheinyl transferase superfamily protein [Janibacter melonis]